MNYNAVGAGVLVALLLLFAAATGGAVADVQDDEERDENGTFGAEVSAFMQASTAEAESEVDERMFQAGMRRAETEEERRTLIERRQARLAARHSQLQEYRDEYSPDQPAAKNRAVATRVEVGAEGLERSVDSTREHAARVGIDTSQLADLRRGASELRGQISEMARQLGGNSSSTAGDDRSSDGDENRPGADSRDGRRGNGTNRTVGVSGEEFDDSEERAD